MSMLWDCFVEARFRVAGLSLSRHVGIFSTGFRGASERDYGSHSSKNLCQFRYMMFSMSVWA